MKRNRLRHVVLSAGLTLTLAGFTPLVYAQAAGGGAGGAPANGAGSSGPGSAAQGSAPGNSGSSATSPSTLGGSVSGSATAPEAPGNTTAGDSAVNPRYEFGRQWKYEHGARYVVLERGQQCCAA